MKTVLVFGLFHLMQIVCTVVAIGVVILLGGDGATQIMAGMYGLALGTFLTGPVASYALARHLGIEDV
ncbi:hypothetical protein LCGC14_1042210 [marine sediment metagenome]|uniref:Uncharacterized protein n=1 Tax=marine sediment metagenome TaxID=412755 RepID=A0A0F9Q9P0_9ZZZZ